MSPRARLLLWLALVMLMAGCRTSPTLLPELVTLQAPESSQAPVFTATALPEGMRSPEPETPQGPTPTSRPGWCDQLAEPNRVPEGLLRVAFIKDQDVWIWDESREARRLTRQGNVEQVYLSQDGQVVAYLRAGEQNTQELWRVNVDGSGEQRALSAADFDRMRVEPNQIGVTPFNLAWIPGTHRMVFNTYPLLPGEGAWIYVPDDLWAVDLDSLKRFLLLPKGKGGHFSFSPDGELAAVFSPTALMIMQADGKIVQRDVLVGFQAVGLGEYYSYPSLQWAPDSQTLLVAIPVWEEPGQPQAEAVIWKVPADGSQPTLVRSIPTTLSLATFSPDLTRLAYFFQPEGRSSGRELHLSELEGQEDYLFLRGDVMERFQWLPDSQHFLYWIADAWQPKLGHVCQDTPAFPDFQVHSDIHWIDANRFLFLSGGEGDWQLNLGHIDGDLVPIADLGGSSAFSYSLVKEE